MSEPKVKKRFWSRLSDLHTKLYRQPTIWQFSDALVILSGRHENAAAYSKTATLQEWLLGHELSSCCIVVHEGGLLVIAGKNACTVLGELDGSESHLSFELLVRNKLDNNAENIEKMMNTIFSSKNGKTVGFLNENPTGSFATALSQKITESSVKKVEILRSISNLVATKEKEELSNLEKSGEFSTAAIKWFKSQLETIVTDDKQIKQTILAEKVAALAEKPKTLGFPFKAEHIEPCYDPVLQSGGSYNLKPSASTQDTQLHYESGTVLMSVGFRFRNYCTNLSRTFFFNASEEQRKNYKILLHVYKAILNKLKHGVRLCDVWESAVNLVRRVKPQLVEKLTKNVGWGTGIEFKDKYLVIGRKNQTVAKLGMVFVINVGFHDLIDESKQTKGQTKAAKYSILLSDTVQVLEGEPMYFTHFPRKIVDYQIAESDEEEEESNDDQKEDVPFDPSLQSAVPGGRVTRSRNLKRQQELLKERERRIDRENNQRNVRQRATQLLSKLYEKHGNQLPDEQQEKIWQDPEAFNRPSQIQSFRHNWLNCDMRRETIICPVYNQPVPFHISTIKRTVQQQIGDKHTFRLIFNAPLTKNSKAKQQPDVYFAHPDAHFIKELTYYSTNAQYFTTVQNQLKELQKIQRIKAKQGKEKPLVKQPGVIRECNNMYDITKNYGGVASTPKPEKLWTVRR